MDSELLIKIATQVEGIKSETGEQTKMIRDIHTRLTVVEVENKSQWSLNWWLWRGSILGLVGLFGWVFKILWNMKSLMKMQ